MWQVSKLNMRFRRNFFTNVQKKLDIIVSCLNDVKPTSLFIFKTSYDTLRSLLSRAFDLNDHHFRLAYLCSGDWLPLLSDWDLDAAVLCASEPSLRLGKLKIIVSLHNGTCLWLSDIGILLIILFEM